MAAPSNLKNVSVVPLAVPLDSGSTAPDASGLSGRSDGTSAAIQSLNALLTQSENCAYTAAGSAQSVGTPASVKSVNTTTYTIDGVFKSKGATDPLWTLTGAAITAGGSGATLHYALCLNAAGTASVVQGPVNQGSTTVWTPAPAVSSPNDIAIVATLKISLAAATVFTPGTTSLTAAGVTATFEDGMDATLWGAYQIIGNLN